jgi:hypothetical protein
MKEYIVTMWENSDLRCLREIKDGFKTEEEAWAWALQDIEFYQGGSFQLGEIDTDEDEEV